MAKSMREVMRDVFDSLPGSEEFKALFDEGVQEARSGAIQDEPHIPKEEVLGRRRTQALRAMFENAGVPPRFRHCTLSTLSDLLNERNLSPNGKVAAIRAVKTLMRDGEYNGKAGLYLWGAPGRGKTGLATALAVHHVRQGRQALWIQYNDFIEDVQGGYSDGTSMRKQRVARECDLIMLDDFGDPSRADRGEPETNDRREIIWKLVNYRYVAQLPMIITSHLDAVRAADAFGKRTMERIEETCSVIHVAGANLRFDGR